LDEFQTVQRRALEKQRASAAAARTAVEDGEQPLIDTDVQLQEQQLEEQHRMANQGEVDFQESLIIERETEIRNIEQSVGELNELFRDVAHIVTEQGGQLDIISENVQNVTEDTRGANVELRSASRYQKNARNRACCLSVILAVILLIIVLAIVLG
jgi:syntaxin 7